jgi:chromosome partitioning protein
MHILMIAAPAAGAGRTTLTAWLGLYAEKAEAGLVVALDANQDPALLRWARKEQLTRPITVAWDDSCTRENLKRLEGEGVELVLIDCPRPENGVQISNLLATADLALIVVRPKSEDLDAAKSLIDLVESAGKPFIFVINQATEDEDMTAAAAMSLAQHGPISPVILPRCERLAKPRREASADAPNHQMDAAGDIAGLWDYLRSRLERYAEPAAPASLSPDPTQSDRHDYDRPATFLMAEMVYPSHVTEILADGLSFRSEIAPPRGSRLTIHLPYLGQFDCDVMESTPEKVDARFVIDEDRRAELLVQVAALLASSREPPVSAVPAETVSEEIEPGAMSGIAR